MSELKLIYIHVVHHCIPEEEYEEFVEYMEEEGIEVRKGVPQTVEYSETGVLLITDEDIDATAVAGYGSDYKGSAKYVLENLDVWVSYLRMIYARETGIPWQVLETDRLIVREMALSDLPDMYSLYESIQDCVYVEQLYDWEEEYEFSGKYIENMYTFFGYGLWLVYEKKTGELVGRAGIENRTIDGVMCQELGYLIRKDKQRMGYATECLSGIIGMAKRELCLSQLFICTHMENDASIGVAEKLNFNVYATDVDGMNIYRRVL